MHRSKLKYLKRHAPKVKLIRLNQEEESKEFKRDRRLYFFPQLQLINQNMVGLISTSVTTFCLAVDLHMTSYTNDVLMWFRISWYSW